MTPLQNQAMFERLLRPNRPTQEGYFDEYAPLVAIAFGAEWCGPCQRLDKDEIADLTPGVKWYYCDVDQNDYTLGYCGLRSIPAFVLIQDGVINTNMLTGAGNAQAVVNWLTNNLTKVRDARRA